MIENKDNIIKRVIVERKKINVVNAPLITPMPCSLLVEELKKEFEKVNLRIESAQRDCFGVLLVKVF